MLLCEIYDLVIPQNAQFNHNLTAELPRKAQEMQGLAVLTRHVGTISVWNVDV